MIIALDIGYGTTKVVDSNGKVLAFNSIVGIGAPKIIDLLGGKKHQPRIVKIGTNTYTVGEDAERFNLPIVDIKKPNSIESMAYKALLLAALGDAARALDLKIVTGLPFSFMEDTPILLETIKEAINNEAEVATVPQPAGSFFDLFLDNKGQVAWPELKDAKVGVIDIGTYTTDLLVLDRLNIIESLSGTITLGLYHLTSAIIERCKSKGIRRHMTHTEAGRALETGTVRKYNKDLDISRIIETQKNNIIRDIYSYINSMWGKSKNIDYIILTGGGAATLCDVFPKFKDSEFLITPNTLMSNVFGFYKIGKMLWQ